MAVTSPLILSKLMKKAILSSEEPHGLLSERNKSVGTTVA
jgi:hypothetical protein